MTALSALCFNQSTGIAGHYVVQLFQIDFLLFASAGPIKKTPGKMNLHSLPLDFVFPTVCVCVPIYGAYREYKDSISHFHNHSHSHDLWLTQWEFTFHKHILSELCTGRMLPGHCIKVDGDGTSWWKVKGMFSDCEFRFLPDMFVN